MTSSAAGVGVPATAGVGWSAAASSSAVGAGSRNVPRNRVERCQTFAVDSSTGSAS